MAVRPPRVAVAALVPAVVVLALAVVAVAALAPLQAAEGLEPVHSDRTE